MSPSVLYHASVVQMYNIDTMRAGYDCHAMKVKPKLLEKLYFSNTGAITHGVQITEELNAFA